MFQKKKSGMLLDHRKFLPVLLLNTTQVSNVLEGRGETLQTDQSSSKLATVVVVVPAHAVRVLLAKVPQKATGRV